jgi:hypothetical protein
VTLTQRELDAVGCATPGCTHDHSVLYFHPRCCDGAGISARYEKDSGELVIACAECEREVVRIAVQES